MAAEKDGWHYQGDPRPGGDSRKICTIESDGMIWVGIRAWSSIHKHWMVNGEPMRGEEVVAWRNLPEPAAGFWDHGMLCLPATAPSGGNVDG